MCLEDEIKYFDTNRHEWLQEHRGEFALIKNSTLVAFCSSDAQAYRKGLAEYGNTAFLIKQILPEGEEKVARLPSVFLRVPDDTVGSVNSNSPVSSS